MMESLVKRQSNKPAQTGSPITFNSGNASFEIDPYPGFATHAIHSGWEPPELESVGWTPVVPPICLSTTFRQNGAAGHQGFQYSRWGNPTRESLEKTLAKLEDADYALCYSTAMAVVANVAHLLRSGDEIICMDCVESDVHRFFTLIAPDGGLVVKFVDCTDLQQVQAALSERTRMLWLESPSNPTLRVVDIQALSTLVKNTNHDILVVVDNTYMSPYFQHPLELGADVVYHSLAKYINGHTDTMGGCAMLNNHEIHERLKFLQMEMGAVLSPFDAFMVQRGVKTLHLRMQEHMRNGLAVARFLELNPCVDKVIYPGLASHPQYELMKKQCKGYSGMLAFYIKGGKQEALTFTRNLHLFIVAESLGGVESLVSHPGTMTMRNVPEADRINLGITDNFIRVSVGLENIDDLLRDLDGALRAAVMRNKTEDRHNLAA
ncbi:putative cystathionine gamma-lyase 2 [Paramacrobiotus metropolitanus]|uniref:putative cystathionine gamma-lyase 2 n=1 Tax=Paramacrobiotus metropolitanus TaxID=2943436 RepID=UPI0024457908|nr:putative cystathionine gamma-lyase 2 [Paramacrobiotus metropolitanus]